VCQPIPLILFSVLSLLSLPPPPLRLTLSSTPPYDLILKSLRFFFGEISSLIGGIIFGFPHLVLYLPQNKQFPQSMPLTFLFQLTPLHPKKNPDLLHAFTHSALDFFSAPRYPKLVVRVLQPCQIDRFELPPKLPLKTELWKSSCIPYAATLFPEGFHLTVSGFCQKVLQAVPGFSSSSCMFSSPSTWFANRQTFLVLLLHMDHLRSFMLWDPTLGSQ